MIGWRGMAGLIVPANNSVVLPELSRLVPDGVAVYETRISVSGELTFDAIRRMASHAEAAGRLLGETGVDLIAYCCMGSSVIKGWDWEDDLLGRLAGNAPRGATSANRALKNALDQLEASTVSLITPYPRELNELLPRFFAARGITVRDVRGVEVSNTAEVRFLSPDRLYRIARGLGLAGVDAVCLLATDMETAPVIDAMERDLGVPVISSNLAIAWEIRRRLGVVDATPGFGRLLAGGS